MSELYDYEMNISDDDDSTITDTEVQVADECSTLREFIMNIEDGQKCYISPCKYITIANYTVNFHTLLPSGYSEITMKMVTYPMPPRFVLTQLESFTW